MIIAVISIAPYLTDKDQHTAFYKINKNVYVKTYIIMTLHSSPATPTPRHTKCAWALGQVMAKVSLTQRQNRQVQTVV